VAIESQPIRSACDYCEARLLGNWTAKAEYLHLDLGSTTNSLAVTDLLYTSFSVKSSFRDDIFRAGLNYKVDVN
jgi:opacity protein-like surface antigen